MTLGYFSEGGLSALGPWLTAGNCNQGNKTTGKETTVYIFPNTVTLTTI